ncbi:alternate-type signal peptide domain-containing protein [Microbacterium rhizophilus]|uniref:alternate-type signal peptide domain-containing protein n=1 Tax=Microbacterium rhizophilus TaxID=3138934 RepID=UPI0031E82A36
MNKFAKSSIAAAAGIVLLLGGAGSLAYWNDSADLADVTVNAGKLELAADETATWSKPAAEAWVPGDKSTYTTTLTLTAEGAQIHGTVAVDSTSYVIPAEFGSDFTVVATQGTGATYKASSSGSAVAATSSELSFAGGVFTFKKPGVYTIPVTVTANFAFKDTAAQNNSMSKSVDLTGLKFVATQTQP